MDYQLVPIIFFSAWLLSVAEYIGINSFVYWLFKPGIVVDRRTIEFPGNIISVKPGTTIKRETGKYRFRDSQRVYFLGRSEIFEFKLRTPFPCKFTGVVEAPGRLAITTRLPIGPLVFLGGVFLAMLIGVILFMRVNGNILMVSLFFLCFFLVTTIFSIKIERRRNRLMYAELQQVLTELNFLDE